MTVQSINSANLSLFDFDRFPPSIANLPAAMTINGTTVYPTFRYNGKDAGATVWNPWGYGQQLVLQLGAPTYNNGSPLLGSLDDSVLFNADGYYQSTNASFADISTEDFVIEIIIKTSSASKGVFSKNDLINCLYTSTNSLAYKIDDGINNAIMFTTNNILYGNWYHVICFADRSGYGQWYVNGIASGAAVLISSVGSITNNGHFILGSRLSLWRFDGNIAYISMWKQASWLDSHLQPVIAKTRFMQLTGMYPQQARGTALPTTYTRNSAAYIDKIESDGTTKLYYVGAGWPRVCSRIDSAGRSVKGYLEESNVQNLTIQSQVFATTWSTTNLTGWSSNGLTAPDGSLTADGMIADGTTGDHYIYEAYSLTAVPWCQSVYAKAGNKDYLCISFDEIGSGANGFFNLTTGALAGTSGTVGSYGIIPLGNGWYRCYVVATPPAGTNRNRLYSCNTANLNDWAGDTVTVNTWLWGAQLALGAFPSSYIPTTTNAITRPADVLTFVANDGNTTIGQGTLSYDILLPSYDTSTDGYAVALSNAGSATINIKSGVAKTDYSQLVINNTTTQAVVTGTTDISTNVVKTITNTWNTNSAVLQVNSAQEGTPSTSCTIPTVTQIDLSDEAGANQINGLISNLKIYNTDNNKKRGS